MPRKYHPTIRSRALTLMHEGYTAEQVLEELAISYGEHNVPKQRETIYAWRKKEKQKSNSALRTIMHETAGQNGELAELESLAGESEQPMESERGLLPPPSLTELLDRKVPKDRALRLLSEWDAAYESERALSTGALDNAVALFTEFPDIPYGVAMAISSFEVRVRYFDAKDVGDLAKFMKRYRPWEGSENRKLMMRAFRQWCENRFDRRQNLLQQAF
ncbi:MAG: hypothetical protein V3R87_02195 [Dehalococcoidia bacterium]